MSFEPVTIVIPGRAHGKVLKSSRFGGGQYLDKKSAAYMAVVASFARLAMKGRQPFDEALCIQLIEIRAVPPSWPKKKQAAALTGEIRPTSKPDLKNILAGVEDAMNGLVWRDDALVVDYAPLRKQYGPQAMVVVSVRPATTAVADLRLVAA